METIHIDEALKKLRTNEGNIFGITKTNMFVLRWFDGEWIWVGLKGHDAVCPFVNTFNKFNNIKILFTDHPFDVSFRALSK